MRCIIFGGAGFLGSYLCEALLTAGYDVTVFEKQSANLANLNHIADKMDVVYGDFANPAEYCQAVRGCGVIFHLISTTTPKVSNEDPVHDLQSNVVATVRMLDVAQKARVKQVIFFSSGGTVYGKPECTPINESHPNNPTCSYGIQKLTIEKYLYLFYHLFGLDFKILRIANPYGPRQSPDSGQGVIAAFVHRVINGQPIEIWGDGSVIRDYIYVGDVVKAAVALLNYTGEHKIFNIGSGEGRSLLDIIRIIEDLVDVSISIEYKESRALDVPVNVLDITKAKEELAWQPSVDFLQGLLLTIDHMKGTLQSRL
jgi:UDP-glucose 4-epimerase